MIFRHVDRQFAAYLHRELSQTDRERVERHLVKCSRCRYEVSRLRALLAALPALPVRHAPDSLWQRIEAKLDQPRESMASRSVNESPRPTPGPKHTSIPVPNRFVPGGGGPEHKNGHARSPLVSFAPFVVKRPCIPRRKVLQIRWAAAVAFMLVLATVVVRWALVRQQAPSWEVRRLQGSPRIGWFAFGERARLRVGDSLTTDRSSRAEIEVADIGAVKIDPGSKIRFTATGGAEHRLELERGALEARVTAPPRLFVVDTRAGRAVDLGCAYRLETDGDKATILHVTSGEVALEDHGRASLTPRGFSCESRRGSGLGTPTRDDAAAAFRQAVHRLDFEGGGDAAAEQVRVLARPRDGITLWHLLQRTSEEERGKLFGTLSGFTRPHRSITRAGIVRGDSVMLETWKQAILYDLAEAEIDP